MRTMRRVLNIAMLSMLLAACAVFSADPITTTFENEQAEVTGDYQPAATSAQTRAMDMGGALPQTGGGAAGNIAPEPVMQSESVDDDAADMTFEDYGVNAVTDTAQDNLSTFALDVDTGSYTLTRSYLTEYNQMPPPEAIRPEEFVNYYPPQRAPIANDTSFALHMDAAPSPFSPDDTLLMRVGVQGRSIAPQDRDPALLIFVVDVSGSMNQTNRLQMAKDALTLLTGQLREDDRVGIVIYASEVRIVLEPTPASEQQTIISAIASLQTAGSTYAEAGLRLGYEMALANRQPDQITRVVLVSDGVANVGETGPDAILNTIRQGVDAGVTLSTIGVGMGNYNDVLLEQLANDGNGNYHYVDNMREAQRIFVHNLTSTLQVIGYDAKIQVEFNPDVVASYRLIGYENRAIADDDFRDDTVDAGEMGAGHSAVALYEVTLQPQVQSGALATSYLRWQDANTRDVIEINQALTVSDVLADFESAPLDFRVNAAVAEFAEVLRESPHGDSSLTAIEMQVAPLAANSIAAEEITSLIRAARRISEQQ